MGMMIRHNRGLKKAPVSTKEPKKVEKKVEEKVEKPITSEYTKKDIEKMNYMKLKSLAKKNGVETDGVDVKDIRANLVEKLGL